MEEFTIPGPPPANSNGTSFFRGMMFALLMLNTTNFNEAKLLCEAQGISLECALLYLKQLENAVE